VQHKLEIFPSRMKIGVISDTHGLLRPEALAALQGSDHILHAGDVGDLSILDRLRVLAPVTVVRGNVDRQPSAIVMPETAVAEFEGVFIYMLHDLSKLDLKPDAAGFRAVIYGHTHRPKIEEKNGVLYFNPGSAGPRRFDLPVSVGVLHLENGTLRAQLATLKICQ
jgi:putative phosphoesterase